MPGVMAYATIGSNRLAEARVFYDALLALAGLEKQFDHPFGGRVHGARGAFSFAVLGPVDGAPASPGNGAMVAFKFDTREEVDAFHAKALASAAVTKAREAFAEARTITCPTVATSTETSSAPSMSRPESAKH